MGYGIWTNQSSKVQKPPTLPGQSPGIWTFEDWTFEDWMVQMPRLCPVGVGMLKFCVYRRIYAIQNSLMRLPQDKSNHEAEELGLSTEALIIYMLPP